MVADGSLPFFFFYFPVYSYNKLLPPNGSESPEPKRIKHQTTLSIKNLRTRWQVSVPITCQDSYIKNLVLDPNKSPEQNVLFFLRSEWNNKNANLYSSPGCQQTFLS